MTDGNWRYARTSVAGTSHTRSALSCQDASDCQVIHDAAGKPILVMVVADGARSAAHSEIGAQLACTLFLDEMTNLFESGGQVSDITREFVTSWLTHFQYAVETRAEAINSHARDFACTLIAAIIADDTAVFLQIGDGAIVVATPDEPDEYGWVFWPQRGEYENVTVFATDPRANEYLELEVVTREFEELALFTDGLQRLALHFASQTVHNPFFRPMFAPLRSAPEGYLAATSTALANFLTSPAVNDRTDDDKTLVLATRRVDTRQAPLTQQPTAPEATAEPAEKEALAHDGD